VSNIHLVVSNVHLVLSNIHLNVSNVHLLVSNVHLVVSTAIYVSINWKQWVSNLKKRNTLNLIFHVAIL